MGAPGIYIEREICIYIHIYVDIYAYMQRLTDHIEIMLRDTRDIRGRLGHDIGNYSSGSVSTPEEA